MTMAEPTTTTPIAFGLAGVSIAFLGPLAGPYALIAASSLIGAMWALSFTGTETRRAGAWLLIRCTMTGIVLTAFFATMLEKFTGAAPLDTLPGVAFAIGAFGNGWRPIFSALEVALAGFIRRKGSSHD